MSCSYDITRVLYAVLGTCSYTVACDFHLILNRFLVYGNVDYYVRPCDHLINAFSFGPPVLDLHLYVAKYVFCLYLFMLRCAQSANYMEDSLFVSTLVSKLKKIIFYEKQS